MAAFLTAACRFLQFPIGDRRCNRTRASASKRPVTRAQALQTRANSSGVAPASTQAAYRALLEKGLAAARRLIVAASIYLESLPIFTRGLVRLPNHAWLIRELCYGDETKRPMALVNADRESVRKIMTEPGPRAEGRKCGQLFSVGGQCTFRARRGRRPAVKQARRR